MIEVDTREDEFVVCVGYAAGYFLGVGKITVAVAVDEQGVGIVGAFGKYARYAVEGEVEVLVSIARSTADVFRHLVYPGVPVVVVSGAGVAQEEGALSVIAPQ